MSVREVGRRSYCQSSFNYKPISFTDGGEQWPCCETAGCVPHSSTVSDPLAKQCASNRLLCPIMQYKRTHFIM